MIVCYTVTSIKNVCHKYDVYEHHINSMIDGYCENVNTNKWIVLNSDVLEMLKRYLWILTARMIQNYLMHLGRLKIYHCVHLKWYGSEKSNAIHLALY